MAPSKKHIRVKSLRAQKLLEDAEITFSYQGSDYSASQGEVDTETALYLSGEEDQYKFTLRFAADLVTVEDNQLITIDGTEYRILSQTTSGMGALSNVHLGQKWSNHG